MRVVVAGAGFAGLLAADRVARAGHEVVVLEARDRAGELGLELADAARAAYVSRIEVTHGVAATALAAVAVADVTAGFERRPGWRVAGGNQRLAAGLAGRLPAPVWLRSPVRSVEHDQDGVRVLTDDGEVPGDAVIVAVPMAVLRALRFSPPVPPAYRSAWQRAGLAHNAKLHVPLTRPAAASAVQSGPERFWTWTATDRTGQVQPVLHAFGGTEAGLTALGVAGEHTAGDWAGLMEGALRSGARAADEVLIHAVL